MGIYEKDKGSLLKRKGAHMLIIGTLIRFKKGRSKKVKGALVQSKRGTCHIFIGHL